MSSIASSNPESHEAHLRLANVIKGVHANLRRKYKKDGDFDKIWEEHCKNSDILEEYADAMHHLAVDHWDKNPDTTSRIDWCRRTCLEYFFHGGLDKVLQKDKKRQMFQGLNKSGDMTGEQNDHPEINYPEKVTGGHEKVTDEAVNVIIGKQLKDEIKVNSVEDVNIENLEVKDIQSSEEKEENFVEIDQCEIDKIHRELDALEERQDNGASKCQEFLERGDFSDVSHHGDDSHDHSNLEMDKKALYSKYGPTKYNTISLPFTGKIRLLDVGSCFNPFLEFDEFLPIGIDISPAVESVYSCDFLHLETMEPLQLADDTLDTYINNLRSPVEKLPKDSFHVVVFSLLLEYFPSCYQRWLCCQKAHGLLLCSGILLIITPDSHHQNKNAPQMKSWKAAIESMGFKRWHYEKHEHLHCMAFRKVHQEPSLLVGEAGPDMMYIPQDFSDADQVQESFFSSEMRSKAEEMFLSDNFTKLPDFVDL